MASDADMEPLAGIRVLDLTRLIPGNYATLVMAHLGADVVKVEDRGAGDYVRKSGSDVDGQGSIHHLVNRGKRSVMLDLKSPEDRKLFESLVETSHVLLESFRPGTLARLGYPPERLHELRPDLVICAISGYGATGPLANEPAHDINLLAWSGLLDRQRAGGDPVLPPIALADLLAGMACVMFTLPYIRHAERTGRGVVLETPMAEALALLPTVAASEILAGVAIPQGADYRIAGGKPGYGVYATRDGHVAIGALEDHFLKAVLEFTGLADLLPARHDPARQEAIRAGFKSWFAARTTAEVIAAAGPSAACLAPVQAYEAMLRSEQAMARDYIQQAAFDPMPVLSLPVTVNGERLTVERGAPRQGEHDAEILPGIIPA